MFYFSRKYAFRLARMNFWWKVAARGKEGGVKRKMATMPKATARVLNHPNQYKVQRLAHT